MPEVPSRPSDIRFLTFEPAQVARSQAALLPSSKKTIPFSGQGNTFLKDHIVEALVMAQRHQVVLAQEPDLPSLRERLTATTDNVNDLLYFFHYWAFAEAHLPDDRGFSVVCATTFVTTLLREVVHHPWRLHEESMRLYHEAMTDFENATIREGLLGLSPPANTSLAPIGRPAELKEIFDAPDYQRAKAITPDQIELWKGGSPAKLIGLGVLTRDEQGAITNVLYIKDVLFEAGCTYVNVQCNEDKDNEEDMFIKYTLDDLFSELGEPNSFWFRST
ncbi:hypothetical protein H0H92_000645 [Tricholoma furcatifolium]|nr:hypothetical protein H0H92_000645 [Tricholoma furcatifolium]